jgi:hypothetical protein
LPPDHRSSRRSGRLDGALPGVTVGAKLALIAGVFLGMVASIVLSFTRPALELHALAIGIAAGLIVAVILQIKAIRRR